MASLLLKLQNIFKLVFTGASHSLNYNLWKYGEVSSAPMETLAESGHTKKLEIEMKKSSKNIRYICEIKSLYCKEILQEI